MEKELEYKRINMEREFAEPVNEYMEHNRVLEQSPDFQRIESEVEKEIYTQFTLDGIRDMELYLADGGENEETVYDDEFGAPTEYDLYLRKKSNRIKETKKLLEKYPDHPERAASLFMQLGSCHWIWAMKKRFSKRSTVSYGMHPQRLIQIVYMVRHITIKTNKYGTKCKLRLLGREYQ